MRILIAEDEIATAKALKLLLERAKYSVDIVHSGTDAWDYISSGAYEVVVLDIMMPGMNGLEVLSRMRKSHISTPVLMLTAKAEIEDKVAGLEAGADDYLAKPFATSEAKTIPTPFNPPGTWCSTATATRRASETRP